jgi:aminoglycoside phosphotransferase (APT) family kinase protein
MSSYVDETKPVRAGEELNLAALQTYLLTVFPAVPAERLSEKGSDPFVFQRNTQDAHVQEGGLTPFRTASDIQVEQFPQGHSNLTYLVRLGDREIVLRRPPFHNPVKSAHDMGREYRVLLRLHAVYPAAPRPLAYCDDETIIGAPFYLMERRRGVILRRTLPPGLRLDPDTARRLSESFIDNLAVLHGLDYMAAGLADLGRPAGYAQRQVEGWAKRYDDAKTDDLPAMRELAAWLRERIPRGSGAALIHNDYKYDNLILDPAELTRIIGVLDWEMCTIGDPLMDLGSTLAYWVEAGDPEAFQAVGMGPTALPGSMTRRQLLERYAAHSGRDVADMLFYYCYGLFKLAVIIQQIYVRYARGHTSDERFARFNERVAVIVQQAVRAMESSKF